MTTLEKAAQAYYERTATPPYGWERVHPRIKEQISHGIAAALSAALLDPSDEEATQVGSALVEYLESLESAASNSRTGGEYEIGWGLGLILGLGGDETRRTFPLELGRAALRAAGVKITGSQG